MEIKLTQFSHGSGCGCKIAPAVLEEILRDTGQNFVSPHLLVGNETKDDAAVYDMGNGTALISTVDFFTPIVNDPFNYGQIAAANALSDVYAMGGKPFLAIAILGFPVEKIPPAIAQQIIAGGKATCAKAGVTIAGGHTIDSPEPFFGLSVNGWVDIKNLKKNSTAHEGDLLFLTKPLGTGVLTTALKRGLLAETEIQYAIDYMCTLNTLGEELGKYDFVHALTDVTGFGLLGHLIEMCAAPQPPKGGLSLSCPPFGGRGAGAGAGAGLSAEIDYSSVPLMDKVKELTAQFIYADNTMRNWKSYENNVQGISGESLLTLCDPQTNGGLLIAVDPEREKDFFQLILPSHPSLYRIGRMIAKQEKQIYIQ